MKEKEEKAIKIVRKFNIENRFRDCGVLNNSIETVLKALEEKDKEIETLKKYDIRNIKLEDNKIIKSPSFTRTELDLMNLGIALSSNFDKLFNDESEEDI